MERLITRIIARLFTPPKHPVVVGLVISLLIVVLGPAVQAHADPLPTGANQYSGLGWGFTSQDIYVQPQSVRDLSAYMDAHADYQGLATSLGTIICTGYGGPLLGAACGWYIFVNWNSFVSHLHAAAWYGVCVDMHYDQTWSSPSVFFNLGFSTRGGLAWKWEPYPDYNNWHLIWERTDGGCRNDIDEHYGCNNNPPPPSTPAIPYCYVY